jgi:hypothetical protein
MSISLTCLPIRFPETAHISQYIDCSLCRLIRCPEHLIGRHWFLPANWRSFIRWSPDQWDRQCYPIECYRNFYCALVCVFMIRVSQCSISLRSEYPIYNYTTQINIFRTNYTHLVPIGAFKICRNERYFTSPWRGCWLVFPLALLASGAFSLCFSTY